MTRDACTGGRVNAGGPPQKVFASWFSSRSCKHQKRVSQPVQAAGENSNTRTVGDPINDGDFFMVPISGIFVRPQ
jgi:hypothetical protein